MNYKAFISYNHGTGIEVARALQSALQRFAKPWYRLRASRIFRDETTLEASPDLWKSIQGALAESEYFLLLASPAAASAYWVQREIDHWLRADGSSERLIIILTEGELVWNRDARDFDWHHTTALPENLKGRFEDEPLWQDLTWARSREHLSLRESRFRDVVARIAARLHNRSLDEITGEDVRQHRRTVRIAWTAGIALFFLTVASLFATFQAIKAQRLAERNALEARQALSAQVAVQARENADSNPRRALLLAVEALNISLREGDPIVPVARDVLRLALSRSGGRVLSGHRGPVEMVALSPHGELLVTVGGGVYQVWTMADGLSHEPRILAGASGAIAFSTDGRWLATGGKDADAFLWPLKEGRLAASPFRLGHEKGPVKSVMTSPDNRWLLTAVSGTHGRLWRLDAQDPMASDITISMPVEGRHGGETKFEFSPDGRWLVGGAAADCVGKTGIGDVTLYVWDLSADDIAASVRALRGHPRLTTTVAFSRDGRWLANASGCWTTRYGSADGSIRMWDLRGPLVDTRPRVFEGLDGPIGSIAFSDDGSRLAAGVGPMGQGTEVRVWDLEAEQKDQGRSYSGFEQPVRIVRFSPDGRRLFVIGTGAAVRVWNLEPEPGQSKHWDIGIGEASPHRFPVTVSSDGRNLAIGRGPRIKMWPLDFEKKPRFRLFRGHEDEISSLALSRDGRWLLTGSNDKTARLWDLRREASSADPIVLPHAQTMNPDGSYLVSDRPKLRVWDLQAMDPSADPIDLGSRVENYSKIAISPDNRFLAHPAQGGAVIVWPLTDSPPASARRLTGQRGTNFAIAIDSRSRRLAAGGSDKSVRIWDLKDGAPTEPRAVLPGARDVIVALQFSPDSRWLAAVEKAGSIQNTGNLMLWDLGAAEPVARRFPGVRFVTFDPGGKSMFAADRSAVYLWNLTTTDANAEPIVLSSHDKLILDLALSPRGRWLAAGGHSGVRVWDLLSGGGPFVKLTDDKFTHTVAFGPNGNRMFTGHHGELWDLSADNPGPTPLLPADSGIFSPDGRWLATGGLTRPAQLWDLRAGSSGRDLVALPGSGSARVLGFDGTQRWLVTADRESVSLWRLRLAELMELACRTAGRSLTEDESRRYFPDQPTPQICPPVTVPQE
jgi:WD40 repeat protein